MEHKHKVSGDIQSVYPLDNHEYKVGGYYGRFGIDYEGNPLKHKDFCYGILITDIIERGDKDVELLSIDEHGKPFVIKRIRSHNVASLNYVKREPVDSDEELPF